MSIENGVKLNNNVKLPWLGFGVYLIDDGEAVEQAVSQALNLGYRSIDTAKVYGNEKGTGKAIRESGIPREEIFVTTKLWNDDQRSHRVLEAFDESLESLGLDYVDLYLVHWPVDECLLTTWQKMEEIYARGRARSIGVSNYMYKHLDLLLKHCKVVPAVNQIEFHPQLTQPELFKFCQKNNIQIEAWSPLMQGRLNLHPELTTIAAKYNKSPAQVILRWDLQLGVVTIPKSVTPKRIKENADIFDFELSAEDMQIISQLDSGTRIGPDPLDFDF